jgi:hypothetical protein
MATDADISRMAIDILRSRMHSAKSAHVAIGVLYAIGHFHLAAKFTHDYECHQNATKCALDNKCALTMGVEPEHVPSRRQEVFANTQMLIDQVIDGIETSLLGPHQDPKPKLRLVRLSDR